MPEDQLSKSEYLTFGGLAVVEGVMMRSPGHYSIACRAPSGKIVVKTEPLASTWIGRQKWLKKPFLRGTLALLDTMVLGQKAMNWAAELQTRPAEPEPGGEPQKQISKPLENFLMLGAVVVGLVVQFIVFRGLPEYLASLIVRKAANSPDQEVHLTGTNYLAEVIKIVMFIGFLAILSRMPAILEVFRYHGAEHKAINAKEANQPLTIENCRAQTRLHPRCGTNFLIIVTLLAFIVFPLIPRDLFVPITSPAWLIALSRLPLQVVVFPILAGVSYEVIRAAGKAKDQKWVNIILKPGLMTQLVTTAEPEKKHLEVAIVALNSVIKAEESGELNNSEDYKAEFLA
ncbi:MAG: DUF1385 domain-containing protein [Chthonomonadaceae bacterium]|nr:DUF1385 domain-containing protein [Chthonomonadaceae bacterium]